MSRLWNWMKAWALSKNITAHSIAVLATAFAGFYAEDPQFRAFMTSLFVNHPQALAFITALLTMYLKYSHSSSDAGKVAVAKEILAKPDAPTPAAIDAADVSTK